MNLHEIVLGAISTVNPTRWGTISPALPGYTINDDGRQVPIYGARVQVEMQIQALTSKDALQLDSMNVSGSTDTIYINGKLDGVLRPGGKGGDLIKFDDGTTWLVTSVMESWPDWCKVAVTQQLNP